MTMDTNKIREAAGKIWLNATSHGTKDPYAALSKIILAELDKAQQPAEPVKADTELNNHYLFLGWLHANHADINDNADMSDLCRRAFLDAMKYAHAHPPQAQQPGKVLTDEPYAWEWQELVDEGPSRGWHSMLERFNPLDNPYRKREVSAVRDLKALYLAPAAGLTDDQIHPFSVDGPYLIHPHNASSDRYTVVGPTKDNWPEFHDFERAAHMADMLNMAWTAGRASAPAAGLTVEEAYDIWRSFHFRHQNDGEQYMDYLDARNAAYRSRLTAAIEAKKNNP